MLPRLVLIGTGPTNLLLLEALARRPRPEREALLVCSVHTELSPGTLPGLLAGRYRPSEVGVSIDRLAQGAGVRVAEGEVKSIDPASRTIRLTTGETLLYNAASLSTAPYPSSSQVPGANRHAHFVHTLDTAMALVPTLEQVVREVPEQVARLAVVGGSPEALEIAMTLRTVLDQLAGGKGVVTLIAAAHAVWRERGVSARLAEAALKRNDITAILGAQVIEVTDRQLQLSNGARIPFDFLVWGATDEGPTVVDEHLQAADGPGLFVAGEVIIKRDDQLQQVGVEPREGARVIANNLLAVLGGQKPARTYRARARVSLAETGGDTALLSYGTLGLEGKWLMTLKQRSDRKLMRRLSEPPQ
jgi:NADH dehydrogenase FAD-containing subunit